MSRSRSPRSYSDFVTAFLRAGCDRRTGGRHGVVFTHPAWDRPFPFACHRGDLSPHIRRGAIRALDLASSYVG